MQLSVIIVNFNVKYFLEHCLLSVIKACKEIEAEIFVVDNNSADGSREYLTPKFPEVKFIWNHDNKGFAKANNSVLARAKGDHILFLNPDTIVGENCFANCLQHFKMHDDCGAVGVHMIDGSGEFLKESKRSLPTPAAGFYKMTGLAGVFPESGMFAQYYAGNLPERENNITEALSGAFFMISRRALDMTGGFDDDFFMYGEDLDLSYRVMKSGLKNYYLGETVIIHFKGESTTKKSGEYLKQFYGAIQLFINKHHSDKKLSHSLMSGVIATGKTFAELQNRLFKDKPVPATVTYKSILITCDNAQSRAHTLLQLQEYCGVKDIFICTEESDVIDVVTIIEEKKINAVVFCINDDFTYNDAITWLQFMPVSCQVLFYPESATSIIGSNNKNERGIVITGI